MEGQLVKLNISDLTVENTIYRNVIATYAHHQIVLMSVSRCIPLEIHPETDQFFRVEKGHIRVITFSPNGEEYYIDVFDDETVSIPAGTYHQVINMNPDGPTKLYTIYSPPHHPPGLQEDEN